MVVVLVLTFYTTRVVLSVLGVEDYGVYNVVCGFVSMFSFLSISMSNGIQRFFNFELGKNGTEGACKVYNTALQIQAITAVVIVVLAEGVGIWYLHNKMVIPEPRMHAAEWIFQFSILSFVFAIMQAPFSAAAMAHERMDFCAIVSVLDAVLKLCMVLLVPFFQGDRLIIYGLLFVVISILNFVLYFSYARKNFPEIRFHPVFRKELFLSMIGFSGWNFFGSFAGIMKEQGMNIVLNLFFGPVVNAARGVASQVNSGLQNFVQNISVPIRPQVIQSFAVGNYTRSLNLAFCQSKLSCCLVYFISLPIILEVDFVLRLWLGGNVPEHTDAFIVIIVLVSYLANLNGPVSSVVHASGKMRKYQVVTSLISILCIPAAYVALKLGCSPETALMMTFVFSVASQCASLRILQGIVEFKIGNYVKKVLLPFILLVACTIALPLIPRILMPESWLRFLIVGTVSVLSIGTGVYYIALSRNERDFVLQMIKKKTR